MSFNKSHSCDLNTAGEEFENSSLTELWTGEQAAFQNFKSGAFDKTVWRKAEYCNAHYAGREEAGGGIFGAAGLTTNMIANMGKELFDLLNDSKGMDFL